jgi:hypothetical protein
VLWGGGHLTTDASGNVILSDVGALKKITQAGVVTTLTKQGQWDGVAIDPSGNIYGSGYSVPVSASPPLFETSLQEYSTSGNYLRFFVYWESSSNFEVGTGGLVIDSHGNLYQADMVTNRIVKFDIVSGTWTAFAGSGTAGNQDGVGTAATLTLYGSPDLAIDGNDNLYVRSLDTIRKITPNGTVTTIASHLPNTGTIAADKSGNVYAGGFETIYRFASDGSSVTYPFPYTTDFITSLTTDSSGNLYVGTRGFGAQVFKVSFPSS